MNIVRRALSTMSVHVPAARIITQKSHPIAGKLKTTEHFFDVPLNYAKPTSATNTLRIFARSVKKHETPITTSSAADGAAKSQQLPWLVYLNGGPGIPCRAPQQQPFIRPFLDAGYQILFLDQRGTGLSTPVTASTLQKRGDRDAQAQYLKLHRADNIVRDCEAIRQALTEDYPEGEQKKWSIMGQSFGGFCSITYLSFYPEGLRESFIFGGLAPLVSSPDEVYRRLYRKVKERNEAYYAKYPEDVENVKSIMQYLSRSGAGKIELPSGGRLTRQRFQSMGIALGFHGGLDSVHDVVLRASCDIASLGEITRGALSAIDNMAIFDDNMIYAILHEPIYCQGNAPNWSAHRMQVEYPEFNLDTDGPVMFTGEMVFPWMFQDHSELRQVQDVANQVASDSDWPALYDEEQLGKNEVPVYAASYTEDMYVDADLARQTAKKIKGCKVFETNVVFHDGVRAKMEEVVRHVLALRDDVID